jgi:hypothetical protein
MTRSRTNRRLLLSTALVAALLSPEAFAGENAASAAVAATTSPAKPTEAGLSRAMVVVGVGPTFFHGWFDVLQYTGAGAQIELDVGSRRRAVDRLGCLRRGEA